MKASFRLIAKAAEINADGTFAAIGAGLTNFLAPTFPFFSNLAAVLQLMLTPEDRQREHRVKVHFLNSKREVTLTEAEVAIPVQLLPAEFGNRESSFTCVFHLGGLQFIEPGVYKFRFTADGTQIEEITLDAVQQGAQP